MKSLSYSKNYLGNLAAFRKPPMTCKYMHPMRSSHWRKSDNEREVSPKDNSDAAFVTTLELLSSFKETSKIFIFLLN
jgi:hypothetical protein